MTLSSVRSFTEANASRKDLRDCLRRMRRFKEIAYKRVHFGCVEISRRHRNKSVQEDRLRPLTTRLNTWRCMSTRVVLPNKRSNEPLRK